MSLSERGHCVTVSLIVALILQGCLYYLKLECWRYRNWSRIKSWSDLNGLGVMAGWNNGLIAHRSFQALVADSDLYDWRLL